MMNLKLVKIAAFIFVWFQISTLQAQQIKIADGHLKVNNTSLVINDFDFVNNGSFSSSDGTVLFSGMSTNIIEGSAVTTFDTLTMQKTSGEVQLEQAATVVADLKFISGLLDIQEHDLTLEETTNFDSTSFNAFSYVQISSTGRVIKFLENSASGIFPIGNSTLNPIGINNFGTPDIYRVGVRDELLDGGSTGNPVNLAVNRTWDIKEDTVGGSSLFLQTVWHPDNEVGTPAGDFTFGNFNVTWNPISTLPADTLPFPPGFKFTSGVSTSTGDFAIFFEENPIFCATQLTDTELSSPIESGIYQASQSISSSGLVESSTNVIFDAGEEVNLLPDFEARLGAEFEILLDGCGN